MCSFYIYFMVTTMRITITANICWVLIMNYMDFLMLGCINSFVLHNNPTFVFILQMKKQKHQEVNYFAVYSAIKWQNLD